MSPLSTKKLSQVRYWKENFKNIRAIVKRKIFNLRDSSGCGSLGEGKMTEQLKEKFYITGNRVKIFKF
jgi:hypothetical protein